MIPRLYTYAAIALALAAAGGYVWWLKGKADRVDVLERQLADEQASRHALQRAFDHERKIATEASNEYQAELARIRSAPSIGPVRLCRSPTGYVPAPTATPVRPDGSAPGRVESAPVEDPGPVVGTDIGPELDRYGGDCEAVGAQLRGLQGWVRRR
jgi:hypothetical protein